MYVPMPRTYGEGREVRMREETPSKGSSDSHVTVCSGGVGSSAAEEENTHRSQTNTHTRH